MAKLSKGTREQMAKALVRHRFQTQAEELMAESVALFEAVYAVRYPAAVQKAMAALEKVQPGALAKRDEATVEARGMRVSVGDIWIGNYNFVNWTPTLESRSVLEKHCSDYPAELLDRIADFALATKTFTEGLRPAYGRALATLEQLGTAKRLQEEWAEALPVIGHLIPVEDRTLPVVQLEAINDEFGLPPAEAA